MLAVTPAVLNETGEELGKEQGAQKLQRGVLRGDTAEVGAGLLPGKRQVDLVVGGDFVHQRVLEHRQMCIRDRFFGADINLLSLAQTYLEPIKVVVPFFLFNQMLAAFLRNDGNPGLATAGVLAGGLFNVFGDYIFVFTFDMGIYGAGLATAIGSGISFFVMLSHFWSKKNTLAFQKPARIFSKLKEISVTGFSTFFIDVAMGILTVLFNRQIMKYLGTSALAIYGPIVNVSTFVQCCAYSVGQASQPIISINFGARYGQRIKDVLRYALYTVAVFSVFSVSYTHLPGLELARFYDWPVHRMTISTWGCSMPFPPW